MSKLHYQDCNKFFQTCSNIYYVFIMDLWYGITHCLSYEGHMPPIILVLLMLADALLRLSSTLDICLLQIPSIVIWKLCFIYVLVVSTHIAELCMLLLSANIRNRVPGVEQLLCKHNTHSQKRSRTCNISCDCVSIKIKCFLMCRVMREDSKQWGWDQWNEITCLHHFLWILLCASRHLAD